MKLTCMKDDLLAAIIYTQKAVSTRTTMPILEGLLLEARDGLKLTGYDMDIGIEATVQANIQEPGSLVINSKMLGDIIRKLPEETVSFATDENQVVIIESGRSLFRVKSLDSEGFPKLPVVEANSQLKIEQAMLKEMIRQTIFAVSTDEARPNLNGSLLVSEADKLEMVSIDGFRMALRRFARDPEKEDQSAPWPELRFIIQGKVLRELSGILGERGMIDIYSTDNHIMFNLGEVKVVSRLIQGEFLNYQSIIPTNELTRMIINTRDMQNAFDRSLLMLSAENNRFPVTLSTPDEERLFIDITTVRGTLHEELNVQLTGKLIDCDFNPRFFLDALRVIDDENIAVSFKGDIGPCVIRPENGDKFAFIVLPLRK
ncbi:MAG: DNA polymerase III subunit beta [Oscillospiraceae bacterium]|nr:DNA polymerase III subunit beta [Oscillospiraceae bacterium]MDD4367397.1 DNA polymerase III subunit beta [Oscillospiraceae bacterium]